MDFVRGFPSGTPTPLPSHPLSGMHINLPHMCMGVEWAYTTHAIQHCSAWLSCVLYRIHLCSLFTSVCERYVVQFLLQINPIPFICWTAGFKGDLCCRRAKLCDWIFLLYLTSFTAGQRRSVCTIHGGQLMRGPQLLHRLDTRHFYNFSSSRQQSNFNHFCCKRCLGVSVTSHAKQNHTRESHMFHNLWYIKL